MRDVKFGQMTWFSPNPTSKIQSADLNTRPPTSNRQFEGNSKMEEINWMLIIDIFEPDQTEWASRILPFTLNKNMLCLCIEYPELSAVATWSWNIICTSTNVSTRQVMLRYFRLWMQKEDTGSQNCQIGLRQESFPVSSLPSTLYADTLRL